MADNNKKGTGNLSSGLGGGDDSFVRSQQPTAPLKRPAKLEISEKKETVKEEFKPIKEAVVQPKVMPKSEPPKIVLPSIIKKDSELGKDILKVIQEVPKEELERILKPTKETKDKLLQMDFQTRDDMSDQEKREFVEIIAKKEPEPEIAQMNGALVWKWQKDRKDKAKKESK